MLVPVLIAYVLFPNATTRILAQTATEAAPYLTLANLGLAGLGLYFFVTGKIVASSTYTKCEDKLAVAEAELRERNREAREMLVPTLVKATDLLARYLDRQSNTPPPKGRQ